MRSRMQTRLLQELARIRALSGLSAPAFYRSLGMSRGTYYNRLENPGSMRVEELERLQAMAQRFNTQLEIKL